MDKSFGFQHYKHKKINNKKNKGHQNKKLTVNKSHGSYRSMVKSEICYQFNKCKHINDYIMPTLNKEKGRTYFDDCALKKTTPKSNSKQGWT